MELKLLVIRTHDIKRLAEFYAKFGFVSEYHKHGNSPYHYSGTLGSTVIEIYPLAKNQTEPDKNLRIGFAIDGFDSVIDDLRKSNIVFHGEPIQTDFGFMVVVEDPDGRKVELYRK